MVLVLLFLPLLLLSCPNPSASHPPADNHATTGFITIVFQRNAGLRHIEPTLDMNAESFDVSFEKPGVVGVVYTDLSGTTTAINQQELLIGDWSVTIVARNAAGTEIGRGSTTFTVEAGMTKYATVTVSILPGTGTISVSASWPGITLLSANLGGNLAPASGSAQIPISFSVGNGSATYSSSTVPVGSYILTLALKEGTQTVSQVMDTVQVLKDQTSAGSILFTRHPDFWGRVDATISVDLPSAFTIDLSAPGGTAEGASVAFGSDTTIGSTVSTTVDSYRWYLNGSLIAGESGSSLTIGQDLPAWSHIKTLVVQHGTVLASESYALEIVTENDSTPPANVTGLGATAGDAQVSLAWTQPADADFAAVEISATGVATITVSKGGTSRLVTGLVNGIAYTFTVKSVDSSGSKSSGVTATATPSVSLPPADGTGGMSAIIY